MYTKKLETENVIGEIQKIIESGSDTSEKIEKIAAANNISIYVTDSNGESVYSADYNVNSRMSSLPNDLFEKYYAKAKNNGGSAVIEFKGSRMKSPEELITEVIISTEDDPYGAMSMEVFPKPNRREDSEDESEESEDSEGGIEYTIPKGEKPQRDEAFRQNIGNEMAESVIYVRIVKSGKDERVIMVNSVLTPLDATVSTLKTQLFVISLVMIFVSLCAAFLISRIITKSLIKTNEGASKLANGDYNVQFDSHDYREISQLSDTLNYAARELGKTDSLQKELIANVSHDLRTPLTMIKGYSEVMRDIPGENTPENVQNIIDETERLSGLVNDMLDISRLKAGTIVIEPDYYNITSSIRYVLNRYNKLREVEGYNISFQYDEEVEIYADEQKMYQVLYNLINNAINYTGEDKTVTVVQKVMDNTLRIEVTDTGNGVSQEDIPYVWDRYYKDKSNHIRAKAGTGLGLSIVKSVLELHGAKYGVSSIIGEGATFWFEIKIDPFFEEEDN